MKEVYRSFKELLNLYVELACTRYRERGTNGREQTGPILRLPRSRQLRPCFSGGSGPGNLVVGRLSQLPESAAELVPLGLDDRETPVRGQA